MNPKLTAVDPRGYLDVFRRRTEHKLVLEIGFVVEIGIEMELWEIRRRRRYQETWKPFHSRFRHNFLHCHGRNRLVRQLVLAVQTSFFLPERVNNGADKMVDW